MPLKILVAEDSADERRRLVSFYVNDPNLAAFKVQVIEAGDGEEGLALFEEHDPDLVVTDLLMPRSDGFALIEQIRALEAGKERPILAISGVHRDSGTALRLKRGFDVELLTKPLNASALAMQSRTLLVKLRRADPERAEGWRVGTATPRRAAEPLSPHTGSNPAVPQVGAASAPAMAAAAPSAASGAAPAAAAAPPPASGDGLLFDRPIRGMLDRHPLGRILVRAAVASATGTLKLTRGKVRKLVYVHNGRPMFVDSNLRNETLGAYLVQQRVIDDTQLQRAMKYARANNRKLGESLVELEMTTTAVIDAGLQAQTQIKIVSALRWPDGAFSFLPGDDFLSRVPSCPVEPVRLTLSALKRFARPEQLTAAQQRLVDSALVLSDSGQRFRSIIDDVFGPTLLERAAMGDPLSSVIGRGLDVTAAWSQVLALAVTELASFVEPDEAAAVAAARSAAVAELPGSGSSGAPGLPTFSTGQAPRLAVEQPAPPSEPAPVADAPAARTAPAPRLALPGDPPSAPPTAATIEAPPAPVAPSAQVRTVDRISMPDALLSGAAAAGSVPQPPRAKDERLASADYAIPPALRSLTSDGVPALELDGPSDDGGGAKAARASTPMLELGNLDPTLLGEGGGDAAGGLELFTAEQDDEAISGLYGHDSGVVSLPVVDDLELEERDPDALAPALAGGIDSVVVAAPSSASASASAEAAAPTPEPPPVEELELELEVDADADAAAAAAADSAAVAAASVGDAVAAAAGAEDAAVLAGAEAPSPSAEPQLVTLLRRVHSAIHVKSYYELLGVKPGAEQGQIEAAYRELSSRFDNDAFAGVDLGDDDDKLFEVNLMIEQASAVLLDPASRKSYDERLKVADEQPTIAQRSKVVDSFGAELFFQDGQNQLRARDFAGAVEAFRQAVEQNAGQPDYHAYLGWALYLERGRGAAGAAAARPFFGRALEIAPDSTKALELAAEVELDVRDLEAASGYLAEALKSAPRLELFRKLRDVLQQRGAYRELEEQYRLMIFRLRSGEPQRTVSLWLELAYLYRDKLGESELAKQALDVAAKLAPSDPRVQAARASLAKASIPWQQACEGQRQRLLASPDRPVEPLRELVAVHRRSAQRDRLFCAAALLVGLGEANGAERSLYADMRPSAPSALADAVLSADDHAALRDADHSVELDGIVGLLGPLISERYPMSLESLGSSEADRVDEGALPEALAEALALATRMLGVESAPPVYRARNIEGIIPFPGAEPRLLVAPTLLDTKGDAVELSFFAARALSCLAPCARHVFERPTAHLKTAFVAALSAVRPSLELPDPDGEVARFREAIAAGQVDTGELERSVNALLDVGGRVNLSAWMRAVRSRAARAGLVVAGDPAVALRLIALEDSSQRAVVLFATSDEFYRMCQRFGLARPA